MFRCSHWIVGAAILVSSSAAFAQRPAGGRPGGFGGFGGFGGGFNSPLTLAANEAVQKELGLNEDQVKKVKTLSEEAREETRSAFAGGFGGRDQSEEERAKQREKVAEALKKVNEKFQPKLNEILDASQADRLKQIQLQASGAQAYQTADVVAALKISKEQQDKLAAIGKEFDDKQRELFARGGQGGERPNFQEMQTKMRELNESRAKQSADVLTAEQKEQFEKLKGKPFDLAQLRPAFGGGRGPGGGQGGGRTQGRPSGDDKKSDK